MSDSENDQTPQPPKPQPPKPMQSSDAPGKNTSRIPLPSEGDLPKTARVSMSDKPSTKTSQIKTSQIKTSQVPLRKETVRITLKATPSAGVEGGGSPQAKPMAPAPPVAGSSSKPQPVAPKPMGPAASEASGEGDAGRGSDKQVELPKAPAPFAPPAPAGSDKPSAPGVPKPPLTPTAALNKPSAPVVAGKAPSVPLRPSAPGKTPTISLKTGAPAAAADKSPTVSLKMGAGPMAPGKTPTVALKPGPGAGAAATQSLPQATTKLKQTGPLASQPRPTGVGTAPIKKATTEELDMGEEESDVVPIILSAAVLLGTLFIFAVQFAKTKIPDIDDRTALEQATVLSLIQE